MPIFIRSLKTLLMTALLCGVFASLQIVITTTSQAVAAPTPATDFLKTRVLDVLKLAAIPTPDTKTKTEINQQLLKLIKPLMNFPEMSKASLGKHWGARTPAERKRFISLFEELVFHSYIKKIRSAESGYRVDYEDESPRSGGAIVEAIAITSKMETELRFLLNRKDQEKGVVVYVAEDVVIDEVSLVQNYREQFNKIITKNGFEALIKKMETQIAKVK
jgi:phospholipid transport system substrate-binding protein